MTGKAAGLARRDPEPGRVTAKPARLGEGVQLTGAMGEGYVQNSIFGCSGDSEMSPPLGLDMNNGENCSILIGEIMFRSIGHLGIAVENIEQTVASFSKVFDLPVPEIRDAPEKKMKVALLDMNGVSLEFLEDYSEDGPLKKIVAERGNVIHHFCLNTDDIEKTIEDLASNGAEMRDPEPKMGLRGKKIAFISPNALDGLLVELSEP